MAINYQEPTEEEEHSENCRMFGTKRAEEKVEMNLSIKEEAIELIKRLAQKDGIVGDVAKSVLEYGKCSEKQAYLLAKNI